MWLRSLALACLVGAALAGPVQRPSDNQCAKQCHTPPHPRFTGFQPEKVYSFQYRSNNKISLGGIDKSDAIIEAIADFHVISSCEVSLTLKNIRIQQELSQEEKTELQQKLQVPLRFSWSDGKFDHVCPSHEESKQSLNMKKALISSFVNQMSRLDKSESLEEEDSNGNCSVNYIVKSQNGREITITKEKDLRSCSKRPMIKTNFWQKKFPSILMYKEDRLVCDQHIVRGFISEVECQEHQELQNPLKTRETVRLTASLSLKLIETKPAEKQSWQQPFDPEEIAFSIAEPRQGDRNMKEVKRVLKEMCGKTDKVIDISIGSDFIRLVTLLKSLKFEDLQQTYQSLKDGSLCSSPKVRNMYADALAIASTDDGLKLMVKLMVDDEVTMLQRTLWTAAMTLRRNTTQDTVAAMIPLMKKSTSTSTLIAAATQANKLCSSEDCEKIPAVAEIVAILDEKLGSRCSSADDKQKLKALTAFGNMGYHGKAHRNIVACVKDRSLPMKIRLAAEDSFRRMETKRPQEFLHILNNKDEEPEIKIALFKSVLRHADERQMQELKRIAEKESNDQVSNYMYTCVQNMKKTKSPKHQNTKKLLESHEIHPQKKEYLTHSKNILFSTFNKASKIGGAIETDLIHSERTKLPTSIRTKVSGFHEDKDMGLLEAVLRTEGLDEILENLFAMKNKLPKLEDIRRTLEQNPSAEQVKEQFAELLSHKVLGDKKADLSMILRFLDTEIMTLSASDLLDHLLSGRDELLKVADLLTKLAHGKDADFSHSFVFMNSKIVVPSVTGRSYSIDLAGSSTVGLTAKAKADLLNLPQHGLVHVHFQPSVNMEFVTSCGMESDSHKPSFKHVSRMHFESDVELSVEVKDGRIAISKVTLPSENIAMLKMSTDIVEIDPDHNEKSIFETKQKKIDYTFEHLRKPLGVIASAKLEVPKPFFTKRFPFVMPFGNGEIALKTADVKSYEMRFEIPKQAGPSMKYRASFNTPGSKVNRLFEAVAEVKQQKDQKGLVVELITPFETVGGRGLIRHDDKLTGASLELYNSRRQLASANVSSEKISSRSRVNYKLAGVVSVLDYEPARVDGTVSVIKGRKNHVSFDIRTNKPESKPFVLKGTIMKEGLIGFSPKSEWKLSSEVSFQSPLVDLKFRKTIERRPKQTQVTSANFGLDYQLRGQEKYSFVISGTSQKSSNKVNTNIKFESTQFPRANSHLTWDMQLEESWKHDIKLNCAENSRHTCIHLKQRTHIPKSGPGLCFFSIEVPERDIHYELKFDHEIALRSELPRLKLGFDISNKQKTHLKAGLDVKYESQSPMKLSGRLEGEYAGARIVLDEKVEEMRDNSIVGDVTLRVTKGKKSEESNLHYVYKKLSKDSNVHHEIESSLKTSSSSSSINGKASIELSSESLAVAGHIGPKHSIQASLKEDGEGFISLKSPIVEGTVNFTSKGTEKSIKGDLKTMRRRIILTGKADLGDKKNFEVSVKPDFDRAPEKRILASIGGEKKFKDSKPIIVGSSRLQIFDILDISLTEEGDESLFGDQEFTLEVKTQNKDQFTLNSKNTIVDGHAKWAIAVSKNNKNKINIELDAGMKQSGNRKELLAEISWKSKDLLIKDMRMSLRNEVTQSRSSRTSRTVASFKKDDKLYQTEWNYEIQPNSLEVNAQMQTPHVNYKKTAVGFSLQRSDSTVSSSMHIARSDKKRLLFQTKIETRNHGLSLTSKVSSDNEPLTVLQLTLDNNRNKKSLEIQLDAKNKRLYDIEGSIRKSSKESQYELSVKSDHPEIKLREVIVSIQKRQSFVSASAVAQLKNREKYTWSSEIKAQDDSISAILSYITPKKQSKALILLEKQESKRSLTSYLDVDGQRKGDIEITVTTSSQGIQMKARSKAANSPEISAHVKCEKSGESVSVSANVMKGSTPLFSTNFNKLPEGKLQMKTNAFADTLFDLEVSKEVNGYNLKAAGQFSPVNIKISRNSDDQKSATNEVRMCRHQSCYSLKHDGERLQHRITLEKSTRHSKPVAIAVFDLSLSAKKSKAIMEMNGKKYGLELATHHRQNENDRCSIESYLYFSKYTSRVTASVLHSKNDMQLEAEIISNTDKPSNKMSLEIKKQNNPHNHEASGSIKLSHPRMSESFLLTFKSKPVGDMNRFLRLYESTFVLQFGSVLEKTWTFQVKPNIQQEANGIRSMEYVLHNEDKSTVASLLLNLQYTRQEKKLEYLWKVASNNEERKGGISFILSDKNGGKIIKVMFSTPMEDYEMQGSSNDINLSLSSSGRKQKEINIKFSERCAIVEYRKSAKSNPEFRSHICVYKPENQGLNLLKFNVQYRQQNCADMRVTVDPENIENVDVIIKTNREGSCKVLKEKITEVVSGIKQEIRQVVSHSKERVSENLKSLLQRLSDSLYTKLESMLKESIRRSKQISEYVVNIYHTRVPEHVKEACNRHYQNIHRRASKYIQKAKDILQSYWPELFELSWPFSDMTLEDINLENLNLESIKLAFQKFDTKKAQLVMERKIKEIKRELQFRMIWPSDVLGFVNRVLDRTTKYFQNQIIRVFGEAFGKTIIYTMSNYIHKMERFTEKYVVVAETKIKQKLVETIDAFIEKVHHLWAQEENVQAAKELVVNAKNELLDAWKNKEHLARSHAVRVQSNITQNLKKLRDSQIEIMKYDPEEGEYKFRIIHLNEFISKLKQLISRFR